MRSVPAFRRVLTLRIGGQQPAADLRARGFELAFRDQTAGAVALYLGKLVAVDFNVVFRARSRRRLRSQQWKQDAKHDR